MIPEDRYINEPGKGKSHHTSEFIRGYDAGFEACEGNAPPGEGTAIQKALKTAEMVHLTKKFMIIAGILTKEDEYYNGFIDGCMSVEGNTQDVCESATDA